MSWFHRLPISTFPGDPQQLWRSPNSLQPSLYPLQLRDSSVKCAALVWRGSGWNFTHRYFWISRFQQVCEPSLLRLHNCGNPEIMWLHFQIHWNFAACWRLIWLKLDTSTTFGPCKGPAGGSTSRLNSFPFLQNIKIKYPAIHTFMIQLLDSVDLNLHCLKFT